MEKTILLIDDEADIAEYVGAVLEDNGYRVVSARPVDPIIQRIRDEKPDLVVLDVMMPGRSGISIYRELRSEPDTKAIPVVLISGMATEKEIKEKGMATFFGDSDIAMPQGFIEKPVRVPALLEAVATLLSE
jgi:CheY-like chemotaxis protein